MAEESVSRPASCVELFLGFSSVGLQGFGGVMAVAQRVLCDDRRWLTKAEFLELISIGQVLPGPNVCNVALMVGDRAFGWKGALSALAGLITIPLVLVLGIAGLYGRFSQTAAVAGALRGMGAVSAGLIFGTALTLGESLRRNPVGIPACLALGGMTFALVAWFKLPLVWVLLAMVLLGWGVAWRKLRKGVAKKGER